MARAVLRLFPDAQLAFGPALENGFYYDIDSPTPIREEDFPRIEDEMRKIVKAAEPFERFERPTAEARELCQDMQPGLQGRAHRRRPEKVSEPELLPSGRVHRPVPRSAHSARRQDRRVQAGQHRRRYWKNDSTRQQLQRLYGTAFFSQKDLDAYVHQLEEAKKRDHRVLGKQLKLFTISQAVGSGLILWMPKGATVRSILETFIKDELLKRGYEPVYTPHIGRLELYRTSGHFPYYRDAQFPPMYFGPPRARLDLAQHRLAAGELDEKKERALQDYFDLAHFVLPGYKEAGTTAEKLEVVHRHVERLLDVMGVDLPEYHKAKTCRSVPRPCCTGWRTRKATCSSR